MANVEIVEGDLLDQQVDAIVNAWNCNFIPWWLLLPQGVSGAIKKRAGVEPFRELEKVGIMKLGQATHTSAGRLPYRAIIHVAGINWFWRASDYSVTTSVRNAIALAEDLGMRSVALPVIGAGSGGLGSAQAEALVLQALSSLNSELRIVLVRFTKH